jgi:hypothetical protein
MARIGSGQSHRTLRRAATFLTSLMLVTIAIAAPVTAAQRGTAIPAEQAVAAPVLEVSGPSLTALVAVALVLALAGIMLRLRRRPA